MQIEIGMFSVLDSENARELEKMAKFFSVVREPRKSLGKMTKKVVRNSENFPRKCRNFFGGPRTEKKFVKWSASWKRLRTAVLGRACVYSRIGLRRDTRAFNVITDHAYFVSLNCTVPLDGRTSGIYVFDAHAYR